MILVKEKEECCGCGACAAICPKQAITMEADECGFIYPVIDEAKCVDCGLCFKHCAFQSGYEQRKEYTPSYAYGARHKEENVYMHSRSGGAFVAISDWVLEQGGCVFGAGYEKENYFRVVHKKAETKEERDEFCGSKYVQSDTTKVFIEVKEELLKGRKVLFTGTGCQVGSLYKFLAKPYENLYTMDIVCHGVPSPKVWYDFLQYQQKRYRNRITGVDFRDKKRFGWKAHRETLYMGDKVVSAREYSFLFSMGMARPSCYNCKYANKDRCADITIADFWGHEKALGDKFDDDKGVSLILVNNSKGMELWGCAKKDMEYVDCTGYHFKHTNLKYPTRKSATYDEFWENYLERGIAYCIKKYTGHPVRKYCKKKYKKEKRVLKKSWRKTKGLVKRCLRIEHTEVKIKVDSMQSKDTKKEYDSGEEEI